VLTSAGVRLVAVPPDEYARVVLPASATLWAEGRTPEEYAGDFRRVATSAYGRRRFRTLGITIDGVLVASCKRYERELRCGERSYRAVGIGAVFTPPELRGRGYASAMLGALLDAESAAGTDFAFLFSDIHPAFYERLGFLALPSRTFTLRADTLPARRLDIATVEDRDWSAVRRCFELLDRRRTFGFTRTPVVWEWMRLAALQHDHGNGRIELVARSGRAVIAYAFGRRIPKADSFVLEEFAFTGDHGFDIIAPLIRSAAGDLRKITGWLPPDIARAALPRAAVKRRKTAIAMLAPLSPGARASWRSVAESVLSDGADRYWNADHI
jgi:GNAT superfamily N-acetyltransferase